MSRTILAENLSDSDLHEWLKYSMDLLLAVDNTVALIPIDRYATIKQKRLRNLFMDARTAFCDICVLAESLLNNDNHLYSRAIEYSVRLLWECAIDFFYLFESDDSVSERNLDFIATINCAEEVREAKKQAFREKYGHPGHDYWSGMSRKKKVNQGIMKNPQFRGAKSDTDSVKLQFEYLNEHVHANLLVGLYWSFDKHGKYAHEYRSQIASGLLNLWLFYPLSTSYCIFNGRGSEPRKFEFYEKNVRNLLSKIPVRLE